MKGAKKSTKTLEKQKTIESSGQEKTIIKMWNWSPHVFCQKENERTTSNYNYACQADHNQFVDTLLTETLVQIFAGFPSVSLERAQKNGATMRRCIAMVEWAAFTHGQKKAVVKNRDQFCTALPFQLSSVMNIFWPEVVKQTFIHLFKNMKYDFERVHDLVYDEETFFASKKTFGNRGTGARERRLFRKRLKPIHWFCDEFTSADPEDLRTYQKYLNEVTGDAILWQIFCIRFDTTLNKINYTVKDAGEALVAIDTMTKRIELFLDYYYNHGYCVETVERCMKK